MLFRSQTVLTVMPIAVHLKHVRRILVERQCRPVILFFCKLTNGMIFKPCATLRCNMRPVHCELAENLPADESERGAIMLTKERADIITGLLTEDLERAKTLSELGATEAVEEVNKLRPGNNFVLEELVEYSKAVQEQQELGSTELQQVAGGQADGPSVGLVPTEPFVAVLIVSAVVGPAIEG